MPKIIIKRSSEWNNSMRSYGIFVDGEKIGNIRNGEIKEFDVSSGNHTLTSKIDWCSSKTLEINLNDHEVKEFELSGYKLGKILIPIGLFACIIYFISSIFFNFNSDLLLILIYSIALIIFYYFSFGRHKYLNLNEI